MARTRRNREVCELMVEKLRDDYARDLGLPRSYFPFVERGPYDPAVADELRSELLERKIWELSRVF